MTFLVAPDPNALGNGDLAVRTDKGTLVALIYASKRAGEYAAAIAAALNAAFCPTMTDLMVTPAQLDAWLIDNPPEDATNAE